MPTPQGDSLLLQEAAHALRQLLEKEPGTPQQIADRLGVNRSTIHRILRDGYTPTAQTIELLLDELGYEIDVTVTRRR